jgi:hypothetical protein
VRDAGERVINNATQVDIVLASSQAVQATFTTAADGIYFFGDGLDQLTDYIIRIQKDQASLLDFQLTTRNVNNNMNDATDSDAQEVAGVYQIAMRSPAFGGRDDTNDFGFVKRIVLGLVVWRDQNNDGQRDASESGRIAGVQITLLNAGGTVVCSATTDASGQYNINSGNCPLIVPGQTYTVSLPLPTGFQPSPANVGSDLSDSDGVFSQTTGAMRVSVTPTAYGYVNRTIDFGLVPVFSLGDFVWSDSDGDGEQDMPEPGINGVVVELWAADQQTGARAGASALASVTTATRGTALGFYQFTSFAQQMALSTKYVLQVTIPNGFQPSPARAVSDVSIDSDAIVPSAPAGVVQILLTSPAAYGVNDPTNDFGFVPACSLGGVVWDDVNGDGLRQANEPFLANVPVTLREGAANPMPRDADRTINSASDGTYRFNCYQDSIEPGKQYLIIVNRTRDLPLYKETTPNVPGNDTIDSDGVFDTPLAVVDIPVVGPPYGSNPSSNDFGFKRVITLGDFVWIDDQYFANQTGHGIQNAGESPIANLTGE